MQAKRIPLQKIDKKRWQILRLLYFIRYMDEPEILKREAAVRNERCMNCHALKEGEKGDLSRWEMYTTLSFGLR